MNAGQYCCGTERIYVMDDVYEEFVAEAVSITQSLIQSNDCKGDVGPTFWAVSYTHLTLQTTPYV